MLDTNTASDLIRNPHGRVYARLERHGAATACLSIIAAAELRFGAQKRRAPQLLSRVETLLTKIAVLPFDAPCDRNYADVRAKLEAAGTPISANDLLIAAHALALQLTLVTHNTGEFRRVPGLAVEDWLE